MPDKELTHQEVIRQLVAALNRVRAAVNAADVHASVAGGANIANALDVAQEAEALYSRWLLSCAARLACKQDHSQYVGKCPYCHTVL